MRKFGLIGVVFSLSCDVLTVPNPEYCDDSSTCAAGVSCDAILHRCLPDGASTSPRLTAIDPAVGPTSGNIDLKLSGANFRAGTTVRINDVDAPVTSLTATEIHVTLPPNAAACGKTRVTLNSPDLAPIENDALFRYKLGSVAFTPVANVPTVDINAKSITAARLDSDAFTDLVVSNSTSSTLSVFRGVGDLTFMSMAAFGSVLPVVGSRVADFDGDGKNDLVASSAASFIFFQGQANQTFSQENQYVYSSKQIEVGDFNNDQKPDLIGLNSTQTQIDIYLNGDSFNFNAKPAITLSGPSNAVAVGDVNGDSHLDFVVMDSGSSQALVYLGMGDGTFEALPGFPTGSGPMLLGMTDLDADGKLDLVIASSGGQPSLMAAFGRGDGTFSTNSLGIAANPKLLVLDDLDCDGQPEAIIYHQGSTQLSVYGNRGGQLGFAAPVTINTGVVIGSVAVSTLDGDSKPDIALLSSTPPASMVLLRNTSN